MVEMECCNGRSARRGLSDDAIALPRKVLIPLLDARVEKRGGSTRARIGGLDPVGFVQVAAWASPGKVAQIGRAASTPRNDMLHVERCSLERLMHAAVLAPFACPRGNAPLDVP